MNAKNIAILAAILAVAAAAIVAVPADDADAADALQITGVNVDDETVPGLVLINISLNKAVENVTSTIVTDADGTVLTRSGALSEDKMTVGATSTVVPSEGFTVSVTADGETAVYPQTVPPTPTDKVLVSIAVSGDYKTEYTAGENFDATGMIVTATYDDESTAVVENYTITGGEALTVETTEVTVSYTEGEVTATAPVAITVTEGQEVPPVTDNTLSGTIAEGQTVTIASGETYTVVGDVTVEGALYVYGTLVTDGADYVIDVAETGSMKAFSNAVISEDLTIEGVVANIDLTDAMSTMNVDNDVVSSNTYAQTQIVVINETLNLRSSTTTVIKGQLVVNDGVTLTVENGATLKISSATAKMIVDGTIVVEDGATVIVEEADDVTVSGSIESDGALEIDSNVTVKENGAIVVDDGENSEITVTEGLTIEAGATVTVRGQAGIADVVNKGTIVLDGAVLNGGVTVSMAAAGATVEVKSFTSAGDDDLTITDDGLVFKAKTSTADAIAVGAGAYADNKNVLTIEGQAYGGIRNLTVTEAVTSETVKKETIYYNHMVLSGTTAIADETVGDQPISSVDMTVSGSCVDVDESLTLGKGITLTVTAGQFNVNGTMTATADGSEITAGAAASDSVDINVAGTLTVESEIKYNINAFEYETEADGKAIYVYTTLGNCISAGAETIYACGDVSVLEDVTIPAGTTLRTATDKGMITIGSSDDRDVTVTVADGATVRDCEIDVMGTLYFANKKDNKTSNTIYSDVSVIGDVDAKYTNIYTALAQAQAGDTVTVTRNNQAVVLDADITVPADVVLEVPSNKALSFEAGVTMTVDGSVRNTGAIGTADGVSFAPEAEDTDEAQTAAIDVNGLFMQREELVYTQYYIAGAYYNLIDSQGNWNYVAPVETAAAVSNDVTDGVIGIWGHNVVGDIAFTGDEETLVIVAVYDLTDILEGIVDVDEALTAGSLTAGTVTLSNAVVYSIGGALTGTFASAAGTVELTNISYMGVGAAVDADGAEFMEVFDTPTIGDIEGDDPVVTIASGTVETGYLNLENMSYDGNEELGIPAYEGVFTIAEGAELVVKHIDISFEDIVIDANGLYAGMLTVDGTLTVTDGGYLSAVIVMVNGTLNVMPADREAGTAAGSADIELLMVGLTVNDDGEIATTSAAAVNAEKIGKLDLAMVSAESSITEDLVTANGVKTTEFYIQDSLWMTAYAITNTGKIDLRYIAPADLTDCVFKTWQYEDDGTYLDVAADAVIGTHSAVYAGLKYDIYVITVFADPGIEAVYIDGVLMTSGWFEETVNGVMAQGFRATVAAGDHEITYKIGTYYSGEAQMTVNGQAVSGNTITTSGVPETGNTVEYIVHLQGIDAETPEYPDYPTGDTTTSSDDGMGMTDYLLIVLVVLIVIMAILVAVRMMRS